MRAVRNYNPTLSRRLTTCHLVLCFYRVYSAYKEFGTVEGAKMIQVNRSSDILSEFNLQMELDLKRGEKVFGIPEPSSYVLLGYRPYCGEERF
jgi:hypothetical protein